MRKTSLFPATLCNQTGLPDYKNEMSTEPKQVKKYLLSKIQYESLSSDKFADLQKHLGANNDFL